MGPFAARLLRASTRVLLALLAVTAPSRAAGPPREVHLGDTAWALPGIVRVSVPGAARPRVALAGTLGYGLTEAQSESDGAHHRATASGALGYAPLPNLELALRLDGRYDRHPDDERGKDSGFVGDPRFKARFGERVTSHFIAGLEASLWLPGRDAPSFVASAVTPEASVLGAWLPSSESVVAAALGFRLDRSENAAPDRTRLRFGDRMALGLSEFNAVLAGIGASFSIAERTALLGEISWDILVGRGAPSALESPLRVDVGLRRALSESLDFELLGEALLSQRPALGPGDPLVAIEPRFSVFGGLRYRFSLESAPSRARVAAPVRAEPPSAAVPKKSKTHAVTLHLEDEKGAPLASAKVRFEKNGTASSAQDRGEGRYTFEDLPEGAGKVVVELDGYDPIERPLEVGSSPALEVAIALQASLPSGELRGLIRSFSGRAVAAKVIVESRALATETDEQGYFSIEIPPGQYQVRVEAKGFKTQTRNVTVQQNGVTVLNAELFEAR